MKDDTESGEAGEPPDDKTRNSGTDRRGAIDRSRRGHRTCEEEA